MDPLLRVFSLAGDTIWVVDKHQTIVAWNQAAEECLGYPSAQAVGRRCYELLCGRGPDGSSVCEPGCTAMRAARQGLPVRCFDLAICGQDGDTRRLSVSVLGIPGARGEGLGLLAHIGRLVQHGPAWPPSLRIRLLGATSVERHDQTVVSGALWRRVKVRALLALLAIQGGRPVHRDAVLEALWPNLEYLSALHNLNTTVYNLRRSLEPGLQRGAESRLVRYDGDCLYLSGGSAHWLDIAVFESAVTRARREPDPTRAVALYEEALALYRGEFLADLLLALDLGWCWAERDRLREIRLSALEELALLCEASQRRQEAADLCLAALATDPCRESACRHLIRLSLWQGDRSGALAHYRRLTRSLAEELGVEPSAETRQLITRIDQAVPSTGARASAGRRQR